MRTKSDDTIRKVTTELNAEMVKELFSSQPEPTFIPVPHPDNTGRPVWRVRLDPTFDSSKWMGLDINGEIVLGRGQNVPGLVTMFSYQEAEGLGVSRRHAVLRPSNTALYLIDIQSTNGTQVNGRSIGVNMPYNLTSGDRITLGRMELVLTILNRPVGHTSTLRTNTDLGEALPTIVRSIAGQLERSEVLNQAMDMALIYTSASEVTVWLVDENTGILYLEAGLGLGDHQVRHLPVNDSLAGKVIESGKPLVVNREPSGDKVKLKTGYLVEAVMYLPLNVGGVTVGVLSVAHRERGQMFTEREEKLMSAIADVTAVSLQNARQYQATNSSLNRRVKLMTAVNYALSFDIKPLMNSTIGHASMLEGDGSLGEEAADIASRIVSAGNRMARVLEQLTEVLKLYDSTVTLHAASDLTEIVGAAVDDLQFIAAAKAIMLRYECLGEPYLIDGDAARLYRSVFNLVDNAIKYSPNRAQVFITLAFGCNEVIIRVRDTGPGIPPDDLPYLFDRYYRTPQTSDGQMGLGLGLEFVRAVAEAHRGSVTARNAEDQGAEFMITLPASLRV